MPQLQSLSGILLLLMAIACKSPFNLEPTKDDDSDLLEISATVSQLPIMDSVIVTFAWPTIAIDNFEFMDVNRRTVGVRASDDDTTFGLRGTITSATDTGWQEVLTDDVDLLYRFTIYTTDAGPIGSSEYLLEIPATTKFIVDPASDTLAHYLGLDVVDRGDTLVLMEGDHSAGRMDLTRKPGLVIMGSGGAAATRIIADENTDDDPNRMDTTWFILKVHDATLINLTLTGGESVGEGGALTATGNSLFRNCIFVNNSAVITHYSGAGNGGALIVSDTAIIENCIFVDNKAMNSGGDIFITAEALDIQITNCTFSKSQAWGNGQSIYSEKDAEGIRITNCLFDMPGNGAITLLTSNKITYSMTQENWDLPDSTNLIGKVSFISPGTYNFRLAEGSPGIDAGNPDPIYNDADNTPNNIGAYGGPYGSW